MGEDVEIGGEKKGNTKQGV
jgi:hypothetical protein